MKKVLLAILFLSHPSLPAAQQNVPSLSPELLMDGLRDDDWRAMQSIPDSPDVDIFGHTVTGPVSVNPPSSACALTEQEAEDSRAIYQGIVETLGDYPPRHLANFSTAAASFTCAREAYEYFQAVRSVLSGQGEE